MTQPSITLPDMSRRALAVGLVLLFSFSALPLRAQDATPLQTSEGAREFTLTVDEAIQIALVGNLALERARLDLETADAQVREGWAELFPSLDVSSSYTRNFRTANPFAGSQAGGFFQTLGFIDWLAFNEQARTDNNPSTDPISVEQYFLRVQAGRQAAGIETSNASNPFGVPNQYAAGLSVTQKLFDGRVLFGAVGASRWLGPFNQAGLDREQQLMVQDVRSAFYGALLAAEQVAVGRESVARARRTLSEISRQVDEGTAPKFQRLSAEVELANLESGLLQSEVARDAATDNLKLLLGIPVMHTVALRGSLEADAASRATLAAIPEAAAVALDRRPDLRQARIGVELERIQLKVAKAEYLPAVDAFFNYNYIGNVPSNRTRIITSPDDPFSFSTEDQGYFSDAYWDDAMSGGFRLTWNIFNGFASRQRVEQRRVAVRQAELDTEFLEQSIQVEVESAIRNVRSAWKRMQAQQQNVERAELNFTYAQARLEEGVATLLEVREASNQLDQTRLNRLQAVHDYLIAEGAYMTALGQSSLSGTTPNAPTNHD
ncbi:MAG: TolC family protein [Rhodothermales bacterium]